LNWRTFKTGDSPGRSNGHSSLLAIAHGSSWKYNALGRNLGIPWRLEGYSDSGWPNARAPLNTVEPQPMTTYLRKDFIITDAPNSLSNLTLSVNFKHGFVVWLNGEELLRRGMPVGAISFDTPAINSGAATESIDLTPSRARLRRGANLLAVELHQSAAADPNTIWDAELVYTLGDAPIEPPSIAIRPGASGSVILQWNSVAGARFRVEVSTDLRTWSPLSPEISATGSLTEYVDSSGQGGQRFYRVVLL
jgi:hypothetical protein